MGDILSILREDVFVGSEGLAHIVRARAWEGQQTVQIQHPPTATDTSSG